MLSFMCEGDFSDSLAVKCRLWTSFQRWLYVQSAHVTFCLLISHVDLETIPRCPSLLLCDSQTPEFLYGAPKLSFFSIATALITLCPGAHNMLF